MLVVADSSALVALATCGALNILVKHQGVIQQVTPYVEQLRSSPLYYGEALLARVLSIAGE